MQEVTLSNGVKMPILGFGVWDIGDAKTCQKAVEDAIAVGFRHIDTAQAYFNEEAVGAAIKASGVKREELFVTTKLWLSHASEEKAARAFEESARKLGVGYLDLYLIHQPFGDLYGAWRAMSRLYREGRARAIGVSNFFPDRVVDFCLNNEIRPMVNQIQINPLHQQYSAQKLNDEYGLVTQAWSPLANGKSGVLGDETLKKIAAKHGKTVAQVVSRWLVERDVVVLTKSVEQTHMRENLDVFDFALDDEDKKAILSLEDPKAFANHQDPEFVKYIIGLFKDKNM